MFVLVVCMQVKFTGYKERPVEERKRKFVEDLHEGHSVIVSSSFLLMNVTSIVLHLLLALSLAPWIPMTEGSLWGLRMEGSLSLWAKDRNGLIRGVKDYLSLWVKYGLIRISVCLHRCRKGHM